MDKSGPKATKAEPTNNERDVIAGCCCVVSVVVCVLVVALCIRLEQVGGL